MNLKTPYEHAGDVVNELSREILNYTPQIFRKYDKTEPIRPKPIASSILLKCNKSRYLITAGHVLRENNEEIDQVDLGVMVNNEFLILNGELIFINPDRNRTNDQTDIAIFELNTDVANDIEEKYSFLPITQADINHNVSDELRYLLVGYPITKTKLKPHKSIFEVNPLIFLTKKSKLHKYRRLGFNEHSNIILDYVKSKIQSFGSELVITGPDTYGISGSGLWFIDSFMTTKDASEIKLVGIMIEWRKSESVVISTRIHLVTEILRQVYDLKLPKSEITEVNIDL